MAETHQNCKIILSAIFLVRKIFKIRLTSNCVYFTKHTEKISDKIFNINKKNLRLNKLT